MSRFPPLPYPVDPEPGVPLDQTMAPVVFDDRFEPHREQQSPGKARSLKTLIRRLLRRQSDDKLRA